MVMTKDSWPTGASRFVSGKKRLGVQFEMPHRVTSHIGSRPDLLNLARIAQQQPTYLMMIRNRQGQYLVQQRP